MRRQSPIRTDRADPLPLDSACQSVVDSIFDGVASFRDQDGSLGDADYDAALVFTGRAYGDDSGLRPRTRLVFLQNLRLAVQRVAGEDRRRQADLAPAEVGNSLLTDVAHAHSNQQGNGEGAAYKCMAELGR